MKQKKIGDILYVFDQTPYVITQDTDAAVINIQNEAVQGFKLINNETVNAKIKGYNYFTMTIKKLEWADYVDNYTVTVAATSNGTCTVDKTDADPGEEVTITVTPAENYELDTLSVTAGGESVTVTNNKFTMPAANVTVTATFAQSKVERTVDFKLYASNAKDITSQIADNTLDVPQIDADSSYDWYGIKLVDHISGDDIPYTATFDDHITDEVESGYGKTWDDLQVFHNVTIWKVTTYTQPGSTLHITLTYPETEEYLGGTKVLTVMTLPYE